MPARPAVLARWIGIRRASVPAVGGAGEFERRTDDRSIRAERSPVTITREQFDDAYRWDDWLEVVERRRDAWHGRYEEASLGALRTEFQRVPTPRWVLCVVDPAGTDSVGTVPYIAKACEQTGAAAGVELRVQPVGRGADLIDQFRTGAGIRTPICVVFDDGWVQVDHWGPRPRAAQEWLDAEHAGTPSNERDRALDEWYGRNAGTSTLREFVTTLRGEGAEPWQADENLSERVWKQAEDARERRG